MKPKFILFLLLIPGILRNPDLSGEEVQFQDLSWISGCWQRNEKGLEGWEQWMRPAGESMLGMSRTLKDGKLLEYEFLQIRRHENAIYYISIPSGQKEAWFKLVKTGEKEAVFENPEHDFPQRISYQMKADGGLLARIEGPRKGKNVAIDFNMTRVDCDGQ